MWYSRLEGMSGSQFKNLDMVVEVMMLNQAEGPHLG